jgi:hypothetical protein
MKVTALRPNVTIAVRLAEAHRVPVRLRQLSRHWICVVDGELAHINDLPRLVEIAIAAKHQRKEAA